MTVVIRHTARREGFLQEFYTSLRSTSANPKLLPRAEREPDVFTNSLQIRDALKKVSDHDVRVSISGSLLHCMEIAQRIG
jgi:hypothetical protein